MNTRLILLAVAFFTLTAYSKDKVKTGFGMGALPAVSFDSDLGFQYGAIVNLFHYGDGKRFPVYEHSLFLEWSRYSKGTGINRIMYDSDRLLKDIRTTFDVTLYTDQMLSFYGFNGYQSIYNPEMPRLFYSHERNMFRAKADFQGNFGMSNFGWVGGYTFYHFAMDSVNINKLGISPVQGGSLFQRYVNNGLIDADEVSGGSLNYIKIGLKYDTRDFRSFPSRGLWTEAVIQSAPAMLNTMPHTKLALIHRQYFSPIQDMVLAYRINYQTTLGNAKVPYFVQPMLLTSFLTGAVNQGLGGARSLRGVLQNRVVGDAIALGNFEFRYKLLKFNILNQSFYLGTNLFFDTGTILKPIAIQGFESMSQATKDELMLQDFESGKFHSSAGMGLKIGWNENFIISLDYGRAFNAQDGESGMYINLNYLF